MFNIALRLCFKLVTFLEFDENIVICIGNIACDGIKDVTNMNIGIEIQRSSIKTKLTFIRD